MGLSQPIGKNNIWNCTTPSLANLCVVQTLFFSSLPLACSRGVEKEKNSTHAKNHTHTWDMHIYTAINKSFISNSKKPLKLLLVEILLLLLLVHQCQLSLCESSRQKTDATEHKADSPMILPFLIRANTTPFPCENKWSDNSVGEKEPQVDMKACRN